MNQVNNFKQMTMKKNIMQRIAMDTVNNMKSMLIEAFL